MGEGYRLRAARASSFVQQQFVAFVVPLRPRPSAGSTAVTGETADRRSETAADRPARKETPEMSARTPYLQVDANGVAPTLMLFLVLVLTALGVIAHAAFI
jgi:hypothetical protein